MESRGVGPPRGGFLDGSQKTMSTKNSVSKESIDLGGSTSRSIDLDSVRPLAVDGGTVVLAQSHRETSHGARIDAGEVPVAVCGVYSPTDLRNALAACGFDSEQTERALRHPLKGETGTRAVSIAERRAGNAEVLA